MNNAPHILVIDDEPHILCAMRLFLPKADHIEYLRVYIRQLRKKLEADPERLQYILTELGNNSSSRWKRRRIQRRRQR